MDLDSVFKAYDIRGRTDLDELTPELAFAVGSSFARTCGSPVLAVGRDCRASSDDLAEALIDGATGQGVNVLDLGLVATDVVYFVSGSRDVAGAMITASHNPPEYNGIKLCRAGAAPVGEETGLADIKEMVRAGSVAAQGSGGVMPLDPIPPYIDHLFSIVDPSRVRPLRVAIDGGNGMAGVVVEQVSERLGIDLVGLYLEPDGTFPNHPADPIDPKNLVDLMSAVQKESCDVGVAFDGDADRAFFVDSEGQPLPGSSTTALIARWFLARDPGATIVHNLITSRAVPETVIAAGGHPVRTRVGHSFIKQVMAETGAVFGGEHSGHYYFRDNYRADSGMLAMLVLLQVMSEDGRPLAEIRREVEPYATSGEINFRVVDPRASIESVAGTFTGADRDTLDGLTVSWPDRWFNVRPSNTEPLLRLNVEGPDQQAVEDLVRRVQDVIGGDR